ncbi:class I SAM-dependent methyltransferase [candidate division KSB1 bacterium]|nr:class I SAM-dependent methyltransferase [candidate division KSB1 bacterium]
MNERFMELFYELFNNIPRQGPGNKESTQRAFSILEQLPDKPKILDWGCGAGKQTIDLSCMSNAAIYAVDNHLPFLKTLKKTAIAQGLENKIFPVNADMFFPGFFPKSFDAIWAEGSIYNLGFEKGLRDSLSLLKHRGYIAVTKVSWLKTGAPQNLTSFWEKEYPPMTDIPGNLHIIKKCGLSLVDYFILPDSAWWENYYKPLQDQILQFRKKYKNEKPALDIVQMIQLEIDIYKRYADYYGYVFYVVQNN